MEGNWKSLRQVIRKAETDRLFYIPFLIVIVHISQYMPSLFARTRGEFIAIFLFILLYLLFFCFLVENVRARFGLGSIALLIVMPWAYRSLEGLRMVVFDSRLPVFCLVIVFALIWLFLAISEMNRKKKLATALVWTLAVALMSQYAYEKYMRHRFPHGFMMTPQGEKIALPLK